MSYIEYSEYVNTNIEWIGLAPKHWEMVPLRAVLTFRNEKNDPIKTDEVLSLSIANGVTKYSEKGRGGNKRKDDLTAYKIAYPNDIVMNSMNIIVGAVGVSKYFGAISPVYYALYKTDEFSFLDYYGYIFHNSGFQKELLRYGKGILIKVTDTGKLNTIRMKISQEDLKVMYFPKPSLEEQIKIATFLDRETAKIDLLIDKQQQLIKLLEEKRQAVISHAVTKGLNPDVPMKDSGVEWLGDMPEHWIVKPLKLMAKIKNGQDYKSVESSDKTAYPVIGSGGQFKYASKFMYEGESVLFGRKGTIDKPLYVNCAFWTVDTMFYTVINNNVHPKYLYYTALTIPFQYYSTSTALPSMTQESLGNHDLAVPEYEEQQLILEYLEVQINKIDILNHKAKKAIRLMKERRTALISAAVTGKIDVRNTI